MTRKRLSLALMALVGVAGAAYAIDWTIDEWRYRALLADRALVAGDRDASVKPERLCPAPENTLVFVIFGQSNAANHGETKLTAPEGVFDFYDGRCFSGDDPQFLATGKGGSPWPAFADALRERGEARPILMANVAVGNTKIAEWMPGTPAAVNLARATDTLRAKGYRIAAALFFQGEADRETPEAEYRAQLDRLADTLPDTPLVLSNSSICGEGQQSAAPLSHARGSVASKRRIVFVGPDTDTLGQEVRYDGCHFTEDGLRAVGRMWADSIRPHLPAR